MDINDVDYGISFEVPDGYQPYIFGRNRIWCFKHPEEEIYQIVTILSDLNEQSLRIVAQRIAGMIFGSNIDRIEAIEFERTDIIKFKYTLNVGRTEYIWFGFIYQIPQRVANLSIMDIVISSVLYRSDYLGTDKEPIIARLIVKLPFVRKSLSNIGYNVPFVEISEITEDVLGRNLRWKAKIPLNFNVSKELTGFVAQTDRALISIRALPCYFGPEGFIREVESRIETHLYTLLDTIEYTIINKNCGDRHCYYYVTTKDNHWRLMGHWSLNEYYNIKTKKNFHMILEKIGIYPTKVEADFLPILRNVFVSFITGPAWLQEETGIVDIMLETMTRPMTLPTVQIQRLTKIQKTTPSITSRTEPSPHVKRFREKIKRDLKRMYEWEKRMWEDVYDTIKFSDVITGMYSMEDKYGKTKLISTGNIVSPLSHRMWKPKKDPMWTSNVVLATRKPFRPSRYNWEELKWHWDEEKKRLHHDIEKKKREVDELFD